MTPALHRPGHASRSAPRPHPGWRAWLAALARALLLASLLPAPAAAAGGAGTLRVASAVDPQTMDPHGPALLYHSRVVFQVDDALVNRNAAFRLGPALATGWQMTSPTTWRFTLRPGVRFHDGTPFGTDDAVFSIRRAQGPTSQRSFTLRGIAGLVNLDALTLDLQPAAPDALLPEKLLMVAMMRQAWAQVRSAPTNQFFPKLSQGTAGFAEFGWTATTDAWTTLNGLLRSVDPAGGGTFNAGRYSNPQLDALIDAVRTEPDPTRRRARVGVALRLVHDDLPLLPPYRRTLNWAMASRMQAQPWPNDLRELRWVRVR